MAETKKYAWNTDKDAERWDNECFDTIGKCLADAIRNECSNPGDIVYVGECVPFEISVNAELVLDDLNEQAGDFAGEVGEDWMEDVPHERDKIDMLSKELSTVVVSWLKAHGSLPGFYAIENITPYEVKQ